MNKEKYLQIFNYLLEFSKLRSKSVRDIQTSKNYLDIVWFSNIPKNDKIDCITQEDFSNEGNYWLKISKPIEPVKPIFPKPPTILEKWIATETLLNKDDLPELLPEIEIEEETLKIEDNPEIKKKFEEYCEDKWFNDSEKYWKEKEIYDQKHKIYDQVNTVYKRLFTISNKTQQFGEEYELVIAVGLMHFKENDETPLICRHILTTKAEIKDEYSKRDSSIIVSQSLEDGLVIETDAIIDLFDQFDSNDIIKAEKKAKEFIKEKELVNPFDNDIHEVLQLLAERIKPGDGKYSEELSKNSEVPTKETIFYAPALILRKRDTRSYTSMYEKIIEEIKGTPEPQIPTLDDLVTEASKTEPVISNSQIDNSEFDIDDTIYFPNKFNDEQIAIIKKARFNNKVLVQGPPGTGKSHTIANLICHLLANGKKVLVTAYTKRALEVLKNKLPVEFKNLTVNLLSGDSSSIQDLEASVNTINDELSNTDIDFLKNEIEELEVDLSALKEEQAFDTNELLKIKEQSTRRFSINPKYQGTLTQVAAVLDSDKIRFDWYQDDFDDYEDAEIIEKLKLFIDKFNHYSQTDESVFKFKLPEKQNLLGVDSLLDFKNTQERVNRNKLSKENCNLIKTNNFDKIKILLGELHVIFSEIENTYLPQKQEIIEDSLRNNKLKWIEKVEKSASILTELQKSDLRYKDRNLEIELPKNKSLISLKNDAKVLLKFINSGNALSGVGFKVKKAFLPKEIKEKLYFIENVYVNGSPCDTKEEFENVLEDIRLKQNFEELNDIWQTEKQKNSYEKLFISFQKLVSQIKSLLDNIDTGLYKIKAIKAISTIEISNFSSESISTYLNDVENTVSLSKLSDHEQRKNELIKILTYENIHPIGQELAQAIIQLDISKYKLLLDKLGDLLEEFKEYQDYKNTEIELKSYFPILIEKISKREFSENELPELRLAILFKNATNEVTRLLNEDLEYELKEKLKGYDSKEESLIAQLAAKKAWVYVLENLSKNRSLRQHLEAWVQAVRKIGKTGKGKRALKFRKIAQEEMEYCKTSVPCWVMPLYKVTETIQPEKGIYDYVIIDEASQLGPDAIFLLYISKNIIIVGDDKQTSPEYIGVDANAMTPFINRHLQGIPFKDFYGTDSSFFDHAKRFCEGVTVLREHFRCMPEIIEFSNKLFYAPDGKGLYPLKQYSENRLEPLMHHYCQNGVVEGQRSNIRNKPEASAIANKINEIVNDDRYSGKSIGVICLQGNAQSALIETLLIKQIGEKEFKKRKIICGNSASFQGDERDIIFLSLVTAIGHNRWALTRPEDERRFNVAVSRAIEQIWLFHSVLLDDLSNTQDLRYKLLDHFINYRPSPPPISTPIERTLGNQPPPFDSWFEVDVFNDIVNKGYSVKPQYEVAKGKYRIDLVAFFPDGTKIAIECDGDNWHGPEKYQDDMLRQKVLERCGWQFFRIRGGEYYSNREKALEPLWKIFKEHDAITEIKKIDKTLGRQELTKNTGNINYQRNIIDENEIQSIKTESDSQQRDLFLDDQDKIVRYINLYNSGIYVMSNEEIPDANYILPIYSNQKNGYLLQCYESGHVNKVHVSTILSRKIGKEYMNGLNTKDALKSLTIIEKEEILGIYFYENGIKKFKAHLTENISCREQLHLQGYKVAYNDFKNIEYQILPINIYNEISRLVFHSFTANGKATNNSYYANEWETINKYAHNKGQTNDIIKKTIFNTEEIYAEGFVDDNKVKLNSIVNINYLHDDKQFSVQLVEHHYNGIYKENGVQKIKINSPLAVAILGKKQGEEVKIGTTENYVKILKILN